MPDSSQPPIRPIRDLATTGTPITTPTTKSPPEVTSPGEHPDVTTRRQQLKLWTPPKRNLILPPVLQQNMPGLRRRMEEELPPEGEWDEGVPKEYRHLKPDYRGMPTPFAADSQGYTKAVEQKLCGLCGKNLDYWLFFICTRDQVDRQFFKGPAHHDSCARYAVIVLPTNKPVNVYLYRCRGYDRQFWPERNEVACYAWAMKGLEKIS
jgi:hypothetical protein